MTRMPDLSDCIAMSEDGDWYAFPKTLRRGQVVSALAAESDWWTVIHETTIHAGFVLDLDDSGWFQECNERVPGAIPAWIARR